MTQDEAKTVAREVSRAIDDVLGRVLVRLSGAPAGNGKGPAVVPAGTIQPASMKPDTAPAIDVEDLYQKFKRRLIDECRVDPILLRLLAVAPEIEILIEPRVEQMNGSTLRGRIARLIGAGYFKEPRATGTVRKELARTGPDPGGGGTLGDNLGAFVRDGFLTREGGDYLVAPGIKVTETVIEAR